MMAHDDFTLPDTDMSEYHEYWTRLMRESSVMRRIDPSPILAQLRSLGMDVDSIKGLSVSRGSRLTGTQAEVVLPES
jgi:hypothetical protein